MAQSILAQSPTTRKAPPPLGRLLADGTCPQAACHLARVYYSVETHAVTCRACTWHAELTPKEQEDILLFLAFPETLPLAEFLAAVAARVAQPNPVLLWNRAEGPAHKNSAPPIAPETPWLRLLRLGEQARDANGVAVELVSATEGRIVFRCESQRRDATGRRVRPPYIVTVEDGGMLCPCQASGPCAHIGAVYLWCQAQLSTRLPIIGAQCTREEIQARAAAAIEDLWG